MSYEVKFPTERLMKEFKINLSEVQPRKLQENINERIKQLAENPKPEGKSFKVLNPSLEVYHYVAHYRLRVGDYRILYDIDEQHKTVWIFALRRRSEKTYR